MQLHPSVLCAVHPEKPFDFAPESQLVATRRRPQGVRRSVGCCGQRARAAGSAERCPRRQARARGCDRPAVGTRAKASGSRRSVGKFTAWSVVDGREGRQGPD